MKVIARSHCKESLQGVMARSHCKESWQGAMARSKLHRATCADQLAPTSLRRAPCLEQLAQSNLRRATCAEQLAQSNLPRAPCLVLSRACFTNASCREKERIPQRWADLACDVLLSGQPWSSIYIYIFCNLLPVGFKRNRSLLEYFLFLPGLSKWKFKTEGLESTAAVIQGSASG